MSGKPLLIVGALSLLVAACTSAVESDTAMDSPAGSQKMEWSGGTMGDILTGDGARVLSSLTAAEQQKLTADAKGIMLYAQDSAIPDPSDSKKLQFAAGDLPAVRIVMPAGTAYDTDKGTTGADLPLRVTPILAELSGDKTAKRVYVRFDWSPAKGEKFSSPTPGAPDGAIQWTGWWELDTNGSAAPHPVKKS